ncbi:MFS general substrate transporter [Ganoderma sinense ZZ0214-1]|uniref:MFS general substrate transporter n=1 Tax=Ganoderma sinense ZZ0214-1 TaxID=1077348 RepID=A0A2G8S2A7_9APHY|nr:MFS general substrate transporter [Ganoderma sinense ZZ0214-1]
MMARTDSLPLFSRALRRPTLSKSYLKEPVSIVLVTEALALVVSEGSPPDGGLRAWLVVFGVVSGMIATVGLVGFWGAFQEYYQEDVLPDQSSSNISWIGSVQNAMMYAPGLFLGRLFDKGYLRLPVFIASAVFVVCLFLTAECTQYWQFVLCQGFGMGLSSAVFFQMGEMVLTHWFKKKLGLALGCVLGGSSIGGCIFPILVKALVQRTSFQWTMRILGFVTLGLLFITNLTMARRLSGTQRRGPLISIAEFKKPVYPIFVASLVVNTLALYTVYTYLTVSAVSSNLDANLSFDLLAIANAISALGQIGSGLFADRYGAPLRLSRLVRSAMAEQVHRSPERRVIPATLLTAVVTYAWAFAANVPAFVVIAVLFGIAYGAVVAIYVQPFAHIGPVEDVGVRIGIAFTLVTAGVVSGAPISGAILDGTGSFKDVGYYGGSTLLLSAALMAAARHFMARFKRACETS